MWESIFSFFWRPNTASSLIQANGLKQQKQLLKSVTSCKLQDEYKYGLLFLLLPLPQSLEENQRYYLSIFLLSSNSRFFFFFFFFGCYISVYLFPFSHISFRASLLPWIMYVGHYINIVVDSMFVSNLAW